MHIKRGQILPLLAILFRLISSVTANLSFFMIALHGIKGPVQAIQALFLCWLFSMLSPGIAPESPLAAIGRYAVFISAGVSTITYHRYHSGGDGIRLPTLATLCFGFIIVIHSMIFSPFVAVSLLKAISWLIVMSTAVSAWGALGVDQCSALSEWVYKSLIIVLCVSLPLIFIPLGYLRNGNGFQGVFNQPQAFGQTMSVLSVWTTSRILMNRKPTWRQLVLLCTSMTVLLLSESRGAVVSFILSSTLSIIALSGFYGLPIKQLLPGLRSVRLFMTIVILVLLSLLLIISFPEKISSAYLYFISKGNRELAVGADSLANAYASSRGGLIETMWTNIQRDPWLGIGFGIASDPFKMDIVRDSFLGLPISAAVEKGVLPVAIWEELGLMGLFLFFAWYFMIIHRGAHGGLAPLGICITALLLNMGESTLFSPSGLGLLFLILLGWASSYQTYSTSTP